MAFSYVAVAAKIPNLKDSRHSESASDLQQCLYLIVQRKQKYQGKLTRSLFYYVIVTFTFFYVISYQFQFVNFNQHTVFGIATIMAGEMFPIALQHLAVGNLHVHSLAFSLQGPQPRVQTPASRVESPAFRVQRPVSGSSVQSPASRVQLPEYSVQSSVPRVQRPESSVQSPVS